MFDVAARLPSNKRQWLFVVLIFPYIISKDINWIVREKQSITGSVATTPINSDIYCLCSAAYE